MQDKVIYETQDNKQPCIPFVKNDSDLLGFSHGCLPMSQWDELNTFFNITGYPVTVAFFTLHCLFIVLLLLFLTFLKCRAVVVFGLNALRGRTINSQGSATGAWNSSNAESLMRYTVNKGYKIHGWELGKNFEH